MSNETGNVGLGVGKGNTISIGGRTLREHMNANQDSIENEETEEGTELQDEVETAELPEDEDGLEQEAELDDEDDDGIEYEREQSQDLNQEADEDEFVETDEADETDDESSEDLDVNVEEIDALIKASTEQQDEEPMIVPFASLVSHSVVALIGLDRLKDGQYSSLNPFAKDKGVARIFVDQYGPYLNEIAQKNVMLLTDDIETALDSVLMTYSKKIENVLEDMFGEADEESEKLAVSLTVNTNQGDTDGDLPDLNIRTYMSVNFPALLGGKASNHLRNLGQYINRTRDSLEYVEYSFVFGFKVSHLLSNEARVALDFLNDQVKQGSAILSHRDDRSAFIDEGFKEEELEFLFGKYDVLYLL